MSEPTIQYAYDPDSSFAADRPPLDDGWYSALLDNGLTATVYWHNGRWQLDEGPLAGRTVRRYSGRSVRMDDGRWLTLFESIRAAWPPTDEAAVRQTVREAALSLARHGAWRLERASDETRTTDVFRLCLFYRIALACGEALAEGTADAAIFHFYWDTLEPGPRAEIEHLLLSSADTWPPMADDA